VAADLLEAGIKNELLTVFLDRADRAAKRKEPRPQEWTVVYALKQ
jgi:hypothetical protein